MERVLIFTTEPWCGHDDDLHRWWQIGTATEWATEEGHTVVGIVSRDEPEGTTIGQLLARAGATLLVGVAPDGQLFVGNPPAADEAQATR